MNGTKKSSMLGMVALLVALPLTGCYEHTIAVGGGAPHAPVTYDHWENYWLAGLIGHTKVDMEHVCPSGRATVEAKQTFLNGLVAALTGGIYTPTTLKVRCAGGRRASLELDEADVAAIVSEPDFLLWVGAELPERLEEARVAQTALLDR